MTHEPERVEDILRELGASYTETPDAPLYSQHDIDRDCARIEAALFRERESKRLAVMKVADFLDACAIDSGGNLVVFDETARTVDAMSRKELAAGLRKAVE